MAMRNVLDSENIIVVRRNFYATSPPASTKKEYSSRIRYRCTIDIQLILMETYILWLRFACPNTIFVLYKIIFPSSDVQLNIIRIRSRNAYAYTSFRIYLRILMSRLVDRRWFEIFYYRRFCLCKTIS